MIRVWLPAHLQSLAGTEREIAVEVSEPVTIAAIIDAVERDYPALRGTIRDRATGKRRPMVRFFMEERDWSHEPESAPVPDAVASGDEPFWIIGAISGGEHTSGFGQAE